METGPVQAPDAGERPLSFVELAAIPAFAEVAQRRPELLRRATGVRRRRYYPGEILFHEGDRGNTAFLLLSGQIELFATPPAPRGPIRRALERLHAFMEGVRRVRSGKERGDAPSDPAEIPPQEVTSTGMGRRDRVDLPASWVCLDSPRPFAYARATRVVQPGALFEELTCLSAAKERRFDLLGNRVPGVYPRAAAARAPVASEALELDHAALLALRESGPYSAHLNEAMRRVTVEARLGAGTALAADELATLEINGIKPFEALVRILADQPGCVVRRQFRAGEVVCREGEFGSTAFIIERGTVTVTKRTVAAPSGEPSEPPTARRVQLGADDSGLSVQKTLAILGLGDLFGEMSCLNFYPRAATVRANEDCTVLEVLRSVLDLLKRSGPYKEKLDADYRERSLADQLKSVPIFRDLPEDTIEELKRKAKFVHVSRYDKDLKEHSDPRMYTICQEGDIADCFWLVRSGTVKITQRAPGGELVLPYLVRGDYLGEIGLLTTGVRTATCTALDHVELVRIDREDFESVITRFPRVRERLMEVARRRLAADHAALQRYIESNLKEFVQQGLMDAQDLLVIDLNSCVRCDRCVEACASTHGGINRLPRDGLRFENYLVPAVCRSCRDPLCMIGCPVGAIRRRDSKEIVIEDWCIGCERCATQCPHGAIAMHHFRVEEDGAGGDPGAPVRKIAAGCDLCSGYPTPNCVNACPHGSARRVDPSRFFGSPAHRVSGRQPGGRGS